MGYRVTVLRKPHTYLNRGKEVSVREAATWCVSPEAARRAMAGHQKRMDDGKVKLAKMIVQQWNTDY
jgi:hypothetical protein